MKGGFMDRKKLLGILKNFGGKKVMVIGDIMIDKYIWGDVSRISPEAPVQVVSVTKETYSPGGAANVAGNIASLGGKALMVGMVGNDSAKNIVMTDLDQMGIETSGILIDPDRPTIQKVRVIGKGQQLLRFDYEKKEHSHHDLQEKMINYIKSSIKDVDVIIISDYAKGCITPKVCQELRHLSSEHGKPVIVDPKPKHMPFYKGFYLMTPNSIEASEMSGIEDGTDESTERIGEKLLSDLDINVLLTRGEKGMSLFEKSGKRVQVHANAKEVYSLTGAGDTVIAAIAMAIASGAELEDASFISNIAAGIKVGKIGTATVSIDEIKKQVMEE
jgi:D-glycero-beta-D-manno-heptose-7-phosphate kinase